MRAYLEFFKEKGETLTPHDLLKRIKEDRKQDELEQGEIERIWYEFTLWLENDYSKFDQRRKRSGKRVSKKTIQTYAATIRHFYKFFNHPLNSETKLRAQVARSKGKIENEGFQHMPSTIKQLLSAVPSLRDRAIILTMFSSGLDLGTTLSLKYGDIVKGLEKDQEVIMIKTTRVKTGVTFRTFINRDAILAINAYLTERTQDRYVCNECGRTTSVNRAYCPKCRTPGLRKYNLDLKRSSALFSRMWGVEPITPDTFEKVLRTYSINSGVISKEDMEVSDISPTRPHSLRMSFSRILNSQGCPKGIIETFMGHSDRYGNVYQNFTDSVLKENYLKYSKFLSLDQSEKIVGRVQDLETENADLKKRMEEMEEEFRVYRVMMKLSKDKLPGND